MKRTIRRILAAAAVIGILIYAGSQVAVNLTQQIETADALEVTVQQTVSAQGWFIREQVPVTGSGSGTAEYLVSDGEKVAKGEKLAVFFSDEGSRVAFDQEGALRQQLDALEYAYSMITSGVDSRKMDQLIMEEIRTLSAALAQGSAADTEGDYAALQQLVVSRGSTETDKEAFEGQIADLKSQIAALQKQYAGGSGSLRAPASGYFVSGSDGYESVLSPAGLDSLTPETLDSLAPGPAWPGASPRGSAGTAPSLSAPPTRLFCSSGSASPSTSPSWRPRPWTWRSTPCAPWGSGPSSS